MCSRKRRVVVKALCGVLPKRSDEVNLQFKEIANVKHINQTAWMISAAASTALAVGLAPRLLAGGLPVLLYSESDWQTAVGDGRISPVDVTGGGAVSDALKELYKSDWPTFEFVTPELYVMDDKDSGGFGDGLVMSWGDPAIEFPQAAAWNYEWPSDPDLTGQTLSISIVPPPPQQPATPPPLPPTPPILSVALVLNDVNGGWAAWAWNVSWSPGAGPLFASMQNTVAFDPNIMAKQGASQFAAIGYDPKKTTTMQAAELAVPPGGVGAPNWTLFPAFGLAPGLKPWNYWGNLVIVPEPTEAAVVTGVALLGLTLLWRRRKS